MCTRFHNCRRGDELAEQRNVVNLKYSLIIEATADPNFFGFYSPDLEGFTGVGHSIEDCLYKARWGMDEHVSLLKKQNLPVPKPNPNPTILIQNERRLEPASR
jgi:predicted RNase H-like HicB family nuclease